ncbi:Dps family protein [Promicromonospora thailandica]|uniref:Starvation-inducible DNA-binding protein n=1 Tax=Promicromonospora thailandica TaxID=765201 RepID=A0A9X2GDI7_9MICO|nr:DNA starvation/stationary phase protection protein [Promicromonospora thailandica]MCP2267206.1 starvation-inducible DNA-binding protein [Promicromonospora thailandica]BFF17487.1 DNA starvation/stationary phase protection protein Dps [Promicromonospora thailandica]
MSTTDTIPTTASDPTAAAAVAQLLSPVVLGLQALTINGKQAHWHVRGSNFVGVHELLDDVVTHAADFADAAAERIVALGLPVDARLGTVARAVPTTAVPAGFTRSTKIIAAVVAEIDAVLTDVRAAVDGLDTIDPASQDVAIEIIRGLEKDRWFLLAHDTAD